MDFETTTFSAGQDAVVHFFDYSELPLSPRSQVLNNHDLLELFFSFLYVPSEETDIEYRIPAPHSQHLLWVALTCKVFLRPAMSILWRSLESWTALLHLIPTLELIQEENLYTTKEAILEIHLKHLIYYAEHVRSLKIAAFTQFVSTHIYASISKFRPNLFPILSKLAIPDLGKLYRDNLNALFLAQAPTLSAVFIGGIIPATEVFAASLLVTLSIDAKFLEHLDISGQLSGVTTSLLDRFKNLKSLQITTQGTSLNSDMLQLISNLPNLKNLLLTLDEGYSFNITPKFNARFTMLESLELTGSVTTIFSILGKLSLSRLRDITLHCRGSETGAPSNRDYVQTFLKPEVTLSLKSFRMKLVDSIKMSWKALKPLESCKQLTHLTMCVDYLDVSRLTHLCCGGEWFTLSSLELAHHRVLPGEVGLTLHDLRIFAEYCPKLTFLAISLETLAKDSYAIQMLWEDGIKNNPFADTDLQILKILPLISHPTNIIKEAKEKSTGDAVAISQYLYGLFPHLDKLVYPDESTWFAAVEDMIKVYQSIREKSKCT